MASCCTGVTTAPKGENTIKEHTEKKDIPHLADVVVFQHPVQASHRSHSQSHQPHPSSHHDFAAAAAAAAVVVVAAAVVVVVVVGGVVGDRDDEEDVEGGPTRITHGNPTG